MEPTDQVIVIGKTEETNDQSNQEEPTQQEPTNTQDQPNQTTPTPVEEEEDKHKIQINDWEVNRLEKKKWFLGIKRQRFPTNYISTTKYTWWNFLFLNLLYQFKKIGNIYFIVIMIFAFIPDVSPTTPVTSVLPVIFILGVNMVREGGEDFLRYLNDRKVNKTAAYVIRGKEIKRIDTCDVRVGDIVKVEEDYAFPADILLISSNFEDGSCKIETANLDGETNLKARYCPKGLSVFSTPEKLADMKGIVDCQPPSEQLYKFKGSIKIDGLGPEIPLSHQNLLLKGSILRSTQHIYGIVIYSGPDTKIMKNMQKGKVKFSFVNSMLNYFIGALFTIQIIFCLIFVGLGSYKEFTLARISPYTGKPKSNITDAAYVVLSFLTYFILLNMLIPVSLFVSLEFVKMIQAWFITMDNQMAIYDTDPHDPDRKVFINSISISSDLNADLSQVDIIFSDKTGTLTENSMVFNKSEIDSVISDRKLAFSNENEFFLGMNVFLLLALCHNVSLREKPIHNGSGESKSFYEGESVDEVALVLGAVNNNFTLKFYSEKKTVVKIFDKEYTFERETEIPFTPDRKRIMALLQGIPSQEVNGPQGIYVCYSKGADSFLFPFIEPNNSKQLKPRLDEHILNFARDGLRTLLLAYKFIPASQFNDWITRYNAAKSLLSKKRKQAIESAELEIEKDLLITGATAIEDRLQPFVPETIKFFLDSGLQLWLLTGDKRETAVNIAQMSNFLDSDSQTFTLDGDDGSIHDDDTSASAILAHLANIEKLNEFQKKNVALVLDGHAFTHCMETKSQKFFINLIKKCKTVICCRATPKQKSMLVDLAKKKLGKNGLAIGDGANDVPMIQKAKVGVGVMGKEGSQAKLSSDYAIPKFFMLKRLLVTHGRYSFKRSAQFIQYSFYKNIVITFIQVYFTFYTMYSGQTLVDSYVLTFYNLVFTLLNPFVFGLLEKDIKEEYLEDSTIGPVLYTNLRKDYIFNWYTFIKWILGAIIHATIIFFFVIYANEAGILTTGQDDGLWSVSTLVCSCVFCVVNLKCYLEMENFTILHHLCMAFSFLTYYAFAFAYAGIQSVGGTANQTYYVWYTVVQSARFWLVHILCVVTPLAFDLFFYGIKYLVWPDYYQKLKMYDTSKKKKNNTTKKPPMETNNSAVTELRDV
ncbi:predicted protein [Naegleria gruberi]|uniref:Phospholipid-transporting ATPase n=1 Tax=Naegleria gruberi TaxID=5762 RepID=D2VGV6_NAEGR|nr:uncharacterized protein NAEGRDRAFT_36836 [Naegleria gruberi]EFC44129.1 predicted protein [Naegleria gruberi]|eukprot:XP_002676873.1 predicted protein [Naegleria gruberi strain NEG-M]